MTDEEDFPKLAGLVIRPLNEETDSNRVRRKFKSASTEINTFFRARALQNHVDGINKTHVAILDDEIAGYVTTVPGSLELPAEVVQALRLPNYAKLPVLLIARLGVDERFTGRRLGPRLIVFAIDRAEEQARDAGCIGVTTDPKDDRAVAMYTHAGFFPLKAEALPVSDPASTRPPPMFVSLARLRALRQAK